MTSTASKRAPCGERLEDVYSAGDLAATLPKDTFPSRKHDPRHVFVAVTDALMLDDDSRQTPATVCQTWVADEIHMTRVLAFFGKPPVSKPLTADEAVGFNHN